MTQLTKFVAIAFVILATAVVARADEASAVKAIEKVDGKITRDEDSPGKPITGVELTGSKVVDATLKELKELKQLQILGLGSTSVTDAGLKGLKELKELQTLLLLGNDITDAGLKELKEMKQLRTLVLAKNKVTDAGIAELKKSLPDLVVSSVEP